MKVYIVSYYDYSTSDPEEILGVASSVEAAKKLAKEKMPCFNLFENKEEAIESVKEIENDNFVFIWNEDMYFGHQINWESGHICSEEAEIRIDSYDVKD